MNQPLVSIISFCKNRQASIRRSIESVLNQTYPNLEFVVQDGASTDGTLEILREYAARDPRVKIISEPDDGHEQAFWKVLRRCRGEIMGTCLSDEELMPDAVEKAVAIFARNSEAGAITGNGYVTDETGAITGDFTAGEFNLIDYLFGRYCPFWPGSFFRTKALADIGLFRPGLSLDCIEFEVWCRLGTDHLVKSIPDRLSKYAIHPGQLSNTPYNMARHIDARLSLIERMFSADGFFGPNDVRKIECTINQLSMFLDHARAYRLVDQEKALEARLRTLTDALPKSWLIENAPYEVEAQAAKKVVYLWARAAQIIGPKIRAKIGRGVKRRAREIVQSLFITFSLPPGEMARVLFSRRQSNTVVARGPAPGIRKRLRLYLEAATLYEARGQIGQALAMWRAAEPLRDVGAESLACQAHLKLPSATERDLQAHQQGWVQRYVQPDVPRPGFRFGGYDGKRKIRVGYHCSFFNSDCIRAMMRGVVDHRDRDRFIVYGYAPEPVPADIRNSFDHFRDTALIEDADFVDQVRSDQIDIFVELSGFSPGHRFTAMASRCAPVQISYLNHTTTSAVPNVDYILSDEIGTPSEPGIDGCFSEKIYRLPGCFFCFDYDKMTAPEVAPAPVTTRGSIAFGCFGSGGKVNETLISYWAEMLRRVPGSTIFVKNGQLNSAANKAFLADRFARYGIGPDRLRIEGGADRQTLLKCYADVDITLDTWPYCGGNTVAESLWQGVPVVSLWGTRFSSRYGASLIAAAGCQDLIGKSPQEYIETAVQLSGDLQRLTRLRNDLRSMCKAHGLGDSGRFARAIEDAFVTVL
jgi:glycosyltransferase involved in cell wall biosynthesis